MSDPRFARLSTDPRFRKPKKKQNRVVVDERFKSVLKQEKKRDKSSKGLVDKYGRSVSSTKGEDNLKRFYRLEGDEEESKDEDVEAPRRPDYARGEVLLESSDEDEDEGDDKWDEESDTGAIVRLGYDSDEVDDADGAAFAEINLDEDNLDVLEAQAAAYSKEHPDVEEEEEEATRTRRIAVVNLDWDHVRSSHLFKIFSSLVSPTAPVASSVTKKKHSNMKELPQVNVSRGKILSVTVYPSDFGKERMAREEKEGPPPEIFKKRKESAEVTAKSLYELGGEDEVDDNALRKYQLERLRYYYAIVACDSVEAASHIYDELQGTELERSANVFDMSFVPDDMSFENEPRDRTTEDDTGATSKGIDFVTPALRHSKVALTWDEDDPERGHVTRRTLTKQEIEDGDFRAFIASSSESESEAESSKPKKDRNSERDRLRALLLGGNDEAMPEGWGGSDKDEDVDMEITFTPGLLGKKEGGEDETTLEKYQRKTREKRKKRKEELKGKSEKGKGKESDADDFFGASSDEGEDAHLPAAASGQRKGDRKAKKPSDKSSAARGKEATVEELELLATSNKPDGETKHFDFKAVLKAEKKGKKKKGKKSKIDEDELQEDFSIDVQDERFKALHEDHHFAIDPSNPHFKKTKGMSALLEERRKRLSRQPNDQPESNVRSRDDGPHNPSLQKLVESVKRKSADSAAPGQGKRRKL